MTAAVLVATWRAFNADKAQRLAASIAYGTMFSLAPLFIVLIAIAGIVLGIGNGGHGHQTAEDALLAQIRQGAGTAAEQAVRELITSAFNKPRQGLVAQIVGWVTFLLGASALFGALQDALNAIWGVEGTQGGWRQMLRDRLASVGMIAVLGFLLLVSFALNAGTTVIAARFASIVPFAGGAAIVTIASWAISLALATVIFALIFKVLPDVSIAWRDVWLGAAVTAVLFLIGQALIALYFTFAGVTSAYGAAGSLLALLLWIYYSALILLFGAEFTKVYAGDARTVADSNIRTLIQRPAGIDPRRASPE
jgi:membrane protein